jgi:hypothetical protein
LRSVVWRLVQSLIIQSERFELYEDGFVRQTPAGPATPRRSRARLPGPGGTPPAELLAAGREEVSTTVKEATVRIVRYLAAAATALMSLMNLPFAFTDTDLPEPLAWLVTVLGVVGLVAAVALLLDVSWGARTVVAVGVLNLVGAVVALVQDSEAP